MLDFYTFPHAQTTASPTLAAENASHSARPPKDAVVETDSTELTCHHFRNEAFNMAPVLKNPSRWLVLMNLAAACGNGDGTATIAQSTLGKRSKLSDRAVRDHLAALIGQKIISVQDSSTGRKGFRSRQAKTYRLNRNVMRRAIRAVGPREFVVTTRFDRIKKWSEVCPTPASLAVLIRLMIRSESHSEWDDDVREYVSAGGAPELGMADMADWLGCCRRTVSRACRSLRNAGIITYHPGLGCGNRTIFGTPLWVMNPDIISDGRPEPRLCPSGQPRREAPAPIREGDIERRPIWLDGANGEVSGWKIRYHGKTLALMNRLDSLSKQLNDRDPNQPALKSVLEKSASDRCYADIRPKIEDIQRQARADLAPAEADAATDKAAGLIEKLDRFRAENNAPIRRAQEPTAAAAMAKLAEFWGAEPRGKTGAKSSVKKLTNLPPIKKEKFSEDGNEVSKGSDAAQPLQWFWQVAGGPIIHAKGLVVGTTPDGDDADATWPLEDLHAQLRWLRIPIGFPPGLMIDLTANRLVSVKDASTQAF